MKQNIDIKLLESILLQICKKINVVYNTENLFLFPSICHHYIVNENYGAGKCQQLATNLPSFNISLLQQCTEPRQVS